MATQDAINHAEFAALAGGPQADIDILETDHAATQPHQQSPSASRSAPQLPSLSDELIQLFEGFNDNFLLDLDFAQLEAANLLGLGRNEAERRKRTLGNKYRNFCDYLYKECGKKPWVVGLYVGFILSVAVLIGNITLLVVGFSATNRTTGAARIIDHGRPEKIRRLSTVYHILINLFSTILLASSNYAMQILTAPTRDEIHEAHRKGHWLEVGLMSVFNLMYIQKTRAMLWICLALSSVPLHLFYNSAIFEVINVQSYGLETISIRSLSSQPMTNDFQGLGRYDWIRADHTGALKGSGILQFLEPFESPSKMNFDLTGDWTWSPFPNSTKVEDMKNTCQNSTWPNRSTYFVMSRIVTVDATITFSDKKDPTPSILRLSARSFDDLPQCFAKAINSTKAFRDQKRMCLDNESVVLQPGEVSLSQMTPKLRASQIHIALPFLGIVIVANLVKAIVLYLTIRHCADDGIITVGDAIASFLEKPDPTLPVPYLITKTPFSKQLDRVEISPWKQKYSVFKSVLGGNPSTSIFIMAMISALFYLMFFPYMLALTQANGDSSVWAQWGLQSSLIIEATDHYLEHRWIYINAFIANSPQVLLSICYFNVNRLCTGICFATEWNSFALQGKALRTSSPQGSQRPTHYLQIPWRWALPLVTTSGLLHWLLSQSLFLIRIDLQDTETSPILVSRSACGFSIISLCCFMALLSFMLYLVALLLYRNIRIDVPPARHRSTLISAACHPLPTDTDSQLAEVQWGVVKREECGGAVQYCTFSSLHVGLTMDGAEYAWVRPKETVLVERS